MKKFTPFKYLVVKFVIYAILAILIFIFREKQVEHLKLFIGSLMLLYGVDGIVFEILSHGKRFIHQNKAYLGLIELIFGIVLIASPLQFDYVCIIWATWSIVRESYEIKEIIADLKTMLPRILSGVESIVVIIFSIMLLLEPGEHHTLIHMCLLTAELVLNPLVVLLDEILIARKERQKENTTQD